MAHFKSNSNNLILKTSEMLVLVYRSKQQVLKCFVQQLQSLVMSADFTLITVTVVNQASKLRIVGCPASCGKSALVLSPPTSLAWTFLTSIAPGGKRETACVVKLFWVINGCEMYDLTLQYCYLFSLFHVLWFDFLKSQLCYNILHQKQMIFNCFFKMQEFNYFISHVLFKKSMLMK